MLEIIKDKRLYKHLLFSIITLVFLLMGWLKYLDYYTMNNQYITVPDFNGMLMTQLDSVVLSNNIRYEILDSVFDQSKAKGIVINQDPEPFTDVKKHRKIYLTINALQTRKVVFPNIYDLSLRQAIRQLKKSGLEVGQLEYRANLATNKVLDYKINGIKVRIGQELYIGAVVDLVVGKGLSSERVIVPNLVGLTRVEANIILKSTSLNIGSEIFIAVEDSASAVIYKQSPVGNNHNTLNIGSAIDLFFNQEKTFTL
jgi:eukaryotic-like serine/threonine-protein kinase